MFGCKIGVLANAALCNTDQVDKIHAASVLSVIKGRRYELCSQPRGVGVDNSLRTGYHREK